jgi:hypothetical protein
MLRFNGSTIKFKGNIYSEIENKVIITEQNVNIQENTKLLVKIESIIEIVQN